MITYPTGVHNPEKEEACPPTKLAPEGGLSEENETQTPAYEDPQKCYNHQDWPAYSDCVPIHLEAEEVCKRAKYERECWTFLPSPPMKWLEKYVTSTPLRPPRFSLAANCEVVTERTVVSDNADKFSSSTSWNQND